MDRNDINDWYLSGKLKGMPGYRDGKTVFVLVNRQRTKDGNGCESEYTITAKGDWRELLAKSQGKRVLAIGILLASQYNDGAAYCVTTDVQLADPEEYDKNQFELSGLLFRPPILGMLGTREITNVAVEYSWLAGTRRKFNRVLVPVWGNWAKPLQERNAHRGDGIRVQGRLSAGKSNPVPRGWRVLIDTKSQKWRQKVL
jgi:hypothetical protein